MIQLLSKQVGSALVQNHCKDRGHWGLKKALYYGIFLFLTPSAFATITAEISSKTIELGASFHLILTVEGTSPGGAPDLIPLQQNFEIDSTEHRVSTTIVNGQMETFNQWAILLTTKKTGTLTIPPIHLGNEQSNPIHITVTSNGNSTTTSSHANIAIQPKRIQLLTDISDSAPYVNQQVRYTIKLIHRDPLLDASYQPPQLADALIIPLGDSEQYQITENNQVYSVEEQRYAFFPQKAGTQTLESPSFQALIYHGMPERVRVKNDPTLLHVKSIPKTLTTKNWLPAKLITLSEQYDLKTDTLKVGTTLTRTIKMEGRAVPAELLPTLPGKQNDGFGVYPEKPILTNGIQDTDVVGVKTIRIAYLLNQPGSITLPAYTINWFNTTTHRAETSTIPAKTIRIQGKHKSINPSSSGLQTKEMDLKTPPSNSSSPSTNAPLVISYILGITWLLTLIGFLLYKKRPFRRKGLALAFTELKHACKDNNPKRAREALLMWATYQWPKADILNLDDIKTRLHENTFKSALSDLSQALYCKTTLQLWQGDILWSCVQSYRPLHPKKNEKLPSINPR